MNPWFAKAVVILSTLAMVAIRAPHGQRSRAVEVVRNARGAREVVLLGLAGVAFLVPVLWIATPWFAFADYPLHALPLVAGAAITAYGLWLFHRSHADLGTNWSITLEVRSGHQLVTHGVYRRIRHPMYAALLLYSLGQAFALPNWVAGPSYLVTMTMLFALRLRPEEQLMLETFGQDYEAYRARTKRIVPSVW